MQDERNIFDAEIQIQIDRLCQKYGISELWLFGSRARNNHDNQSDFDFAYTMDHNNYALDLFDFADALELLLESTIDVVAYKHMKPYFKNRVEKEMIKIYEAA